MRNLFILFSLFLVACHPKGETKKSDNYQEPKGLVLGNENLKAIFDSENGALLSFTSKQTGWHIQRRPELALSFELLVPVPEKRNNPVLGNRQKLASAVVSADKKSITFTWNASLLNPLNNINNLPKITRQDAWTLKHPEYTKIEEAYIRKIVSELKDFDNVFYELINEPYSGEVFHSVDVQQDWQDLVAGVITNTEKGFKFKHLIQQNISTGPEAYADPNPDVSILSFHYAVGENAAINYHLNKLLSDGETGFAGPYEHPYRQEAWHFFLNGGGMFDHLDYSYIVNFEDGTYKMPESSPGWGGKVLRDQFMVLKNFFNTIDFVKMKLDNALLAKYNPKRLACSVFAKKYSLYVVYFSRKGKDDMFNYSLRFTGALTPMYSEKYSIYTTSDDGIKLWLNGKLIIDNWTSHSKSTDSAIIKLKAGQKIQLKADYFNSLFGASLNLSWKSKSQKLQIISSTAFTSPDKKPGLSVMYFEDTEMKSLVDQGCASQISFDGDIYHILGKDTQLLTINPSVNLVLGKFKVIWINSIDGKPLKQAIIESAGNPFELISPPFLHDIL